MANKKKNVEEKNKKVNKKELKKEKEFEKLVAEEEIDEIEELEEEFDDEDANEEVIVKEKKRSEGKCACGDDCNCGCSCNNETMVLKFLIGVSICISVITLLVVLIVLNKVNNINSYYEKDEVVETGTETSADYDVSMFEAISTDDFIEMFDKDDDKIRFVYTGRETCSYCVAFLPALQQSVKDYDYTLYYLDTSGVTESAYNEIIEFDEDLEESFLATPMVYAIKNGEVINYNDGYTEYSTYVEFLEDNKVKEK